MADTNLQNLNVKSSKLSSTGVTFYEISYSTSLSNENGNIDQSGDKIIWRRYSEVRDLYKALSKHYPGKQLSELPKGSYLDRFKQEVIESRRENIHKLLQNIFQSKELLDSKQFRNFLTQQARRSTLPTFGIDKFNLPKIRNPTISADNSNPLFSEETQNTSKERCHVYKVGPNSSLVMQESCIQEYDNSTDTNSSKLNTSINSPEKELQSSDNSLHHSLIDHYTSPYQSLASFPETEGEGFDVSSGSNHGEHTCIYSIGSGSDDSYQPEMEFDSINPLLLDPLLQPLDTADNSTGELNENIPEKPSEDSMEILLLNDPLVQFDSTNSEVNTNLTVDMSMVNIEEKSSDKNASEPEWWENAANETEDALKELEQQTKSISIKSPPIHSVYETLPLNNVKQPLLDGNDQISTPNPVNIINSGDDPMAGFEGVTKGGELYSSGIELCKKGKLEEGLTMLENGIELFFVASRNVNLDANYRKKLRSSLKKYLTYAEQVKTQLNEINLQKSNKFPSEQSENKHIFKTPITLDELKVIGIIKNRYMLVQSCKATDPTQKPFLLKTVQKNAIHFADPRHRHVKMSRNSLPSNPHPNVVQLLGCVQSSHLIYTMLEYIEGGDLSQLISKHHKGDFLQSNGDNFIRWTSQLISTLEELHLFGIFYLHLCPWDVLIQEQNNSVKLSYPARWEDTPDRLQESKNIPFIAPECIHPITPVYSQSADWWSLGAICYELVTGQNLMATHREGFREGKSIFFPSDCFSQSTLDKGNVTSFISQLLTYNYTERMQFVNNIKLHPIFNNVDWGRLRTSKFSMQSSQESHF